MSLKDFRESIRELLDLSTTEDIVTPDMEDTSYDLYQLNELEEELKKHDEN